MFITGLVFTIIGLIFTALSMTVQFPTTSDCPITPKEWRVWTTTVSLHWTLAKICFAVVLFLFCLCQLRGS